MERRDEVHAIQGGLLTTRIADLDLRADLKRVVAQAGYETCTPIQEMALPDALAGHDIIAVAKTGTGKTLAFLIPILQSLEPVGEVQALVVCPTRELALQVGGEAEKLGEPLGVKVAVLYGGTSMGSQKQQLLSGTDLVVGTPGRLLDFITSAYLPTRRIRWLVLDEADRMLDMGFIDDVDKIIRRVPMSRQTMLFSATVPAAIAALAQRYMLYPREFRVDKETRVPESIEQLFYVSPHGKKVEMLRAILRSERPHKALIFTARKDATSEIARRLRSDGHEVYPLSSNLRQSDRERVLTAFREGRTRFVVATDVAARGIDIDDISHVINVDLPMEPQDYVHRIGRTGRVERSGRAISLVDSREVPVVRQIESLLGRTFKLETLPGFETGARSGEADERHGSSRRPRGHARRGPSQDGSQAERRTAPAANRRPRRRARRGHGGGGGTKSGARGGG